MKKLSKRQLKTLEPCGLEERLALFGNKKKLSIKQALKRGFTHRQVKWVIWELYAKCLISDKTHMKLVNKLSKLYRRLPC